MNKLWFCLFYLPWNYFYIASKSKLTLENLVVSKEKLFFLVYLSEASIANSKLKAAFQKLILLKIKIAFLIAVFAINLLHQFKRNLWGSNTFKIEVVFSLFALNFLLQIHVKSNVWESNIFQMIFFIWSICPKFLCTTCESKVMFENPIIYKSDLYLHPFQEYHASFLSQRHIIQLLACHISLVGD